MYLSAVHKRQSEGMILVTVVMVLMVMSIFTVTILSQSVNQSQTTQEKVDEIKAKQLASGVFWKAFSEMNGGANPTGVSETLDGKVFTATVGSRPADVTQSSSYSVSVTY